MSDRVARGIEQGLFAASVAGALFCWWIDAPLGVGTNGAAAYMLLLSLLSDRGT